MPDSPRMDCFLLIARPNIGSDSEIGISSFRPMPKEFTPQAVLVIDDEPLIRWAISEGLSQAGHEVVTASDGDGGLRAVATAQRPFDVVFLDLRLPDSNDLLLLTAIRTWAPRSAVVLMTASDKPDVVTEAHRLGVYRVLKQAV